MRAGLGSTSGRHYGCRGDRQLVPKAWLEASTRKVSEGWPDRYGTHGYLWWIPAMASERGAFLAVGYGGQFLLIAPASSAVVAVTSSHSGKGAAWDRELLRRLERELLPATRAVHE